MAKPSTALSAATLETARHLAISGAVANSTLRQFPGGWALILQTKADVLYIIKTERGKPRLFKTIETGAKAAKSIFLPGVYIEFDGWTPEQKSLKGL